MVIMKQKLLTFNIPTLYLCFQSLTRCFLSGYAINYDQVKLSDLLMVFTVGLAKDIISVFYFLPLIYLVSIFFQLIINRFTKVKIALTFTSYFIITAILIFTLVAEIIFWDEFGTKFNFIAVDYIIYTNEIIGTLKESIPFYEIVTGIILSALLILFFFRNKILSNIATFSITYFAIITLIFFSLSIFLFNFYDEKKFEFSTNRYANELAQNGPYQFFSAFFDNSLDYEKFYPTIDQKLALQTVRATFEIPENLFLNDNSIDRTITNDLADSSKVEKYNIIIITVESLSAEFMAKFGNKSGITPNLDKIADASIFFTNIYAAGTRTVRGLEAITLSVPPIPGSSIIRRPHNQQLFTISSPFVDQGYDINFIFGGYSYFDNLKNYFKNNNFNIVDRNDLKSNEISFSNIWGVADEDILRKSIEVANKSYSSGRPFFSLVMTTSNHRPYTFPEGRIDIPSGAGRKAAVKYTDFAIGKFLENAKEQPWFDKTIFIITADHCASSAGKTDLPISKYHIPLMIYAPEILKPKVINNLGSQIDIAPTILGILNFKYKTKFFGSDIIKTPKNRAFIGTYQLLGYFKDEHLVVLAPKLKPLVYKLVGNEKIRTSKPELIDEAISFYMLANRNYMNNEMKDFNTSEK